MEDQEQGLFNRKFTDKWYSNYYKLEAISKQKGAPAEEPDGELVRWIEIQRNIRHMLPSELKRKLAALDFDFEATGSSWEAMYRLLARFVESNGHACLPADQKHEVLSDWLMRQVQHKRLLSENQFQRLDNLGVDWEAAISRDHRWQLMLWRLQSFYNAFGHCQVPQRWAADKQLANWVTVQRRAHAQHKLREDRQRQLSALGFVWDIKTQYNAQWERYFNDLVSFQQQHGHCRVPGKYEKLVSWIERQRTAKTNNTMPADRARRLDEINFIWSFNDIKKHGWEKRYMELCAYKRQHGHSFVPVNCKENKALGIWVASQRWLESKCKLSAGKKEKLNAQGFVWSKDTQRQLLSVYDTQWETSFEKLKAYKQAYGSCQVSLKVDPVLQRWTRWQRVLFYQGKLTAERIHRLNEIRFPWSIQEGYWIKMYEALVSFREQYAHTQVPFQWAPNPRLAAWVYRTKLQKTELPPQKVELLNELGFNWSLSRRTMISWSAMYSLLVAFKQAHGHTRVPIGWPENPKLGKWVSRMRYQSAILDPERVSLLEAIAFDWGHRQIPREAARNRKKPALTLQ